MPSSTVAAHLTVADLRFSSEKQREVMRLVLEHFAEFKEREQHHYLLNGMATTHVMKDAVESDVCLKAFWPKHLVTHERVPGTYGTRTIYGIEPGVFSKVNSGVRNVLDQLANKGYLLKVGNEDERRWLPPKSLIGETL